MWRADSKNGLAKYYVDEPLYRPYLDSLLHLGIPVINRSAWLNAVTTHLTEDELQLLSNKSYVKNISMVSTVTLLGRGMNVYREINYGLLFWQTNAIAF